MHSLVESRRYSSPIICTVLLLQDAVSRFAIDGRAMKIHFHRQGFNGNRNSQEDQLFRSSAILRSTEPGVFCLSSSHFRVRTIWACS